MKPSREFWIEATDRTHLYYKVAAASAEEALAAFEGGVCDTGTDCARHWVERY